MCRVCRVLREVVYVCVCVCVCVLRERGIMYGMCIRTYVCIK